MRLKTPLVALSLALLAPPARASIFGEENVQLLALVSQGIEEINQAGQTVAQLKQTYDETRKYVGLAQDAVDGFQQFGAFTDSVFKNPGQALRSAMPGFEELSRDLQSPASWGKGTGELQRLVRVCLGGGDCTSFREAVTAKQARESISRTFGTSPVQRDDIEAVDVEAGRAISSSMAAVASSSVAGEQARALMDKCMEGADNKAVAACQAAANLGQLMQVEQTATLNQQLAQSNRLKALELAETNSARKRALREIRERHEMLQAGAKAMVPPVMRLSPVPNEMGGAR